MADGRAFTKRQTLNRQRLTLAYQKAIFQPMKKRVIFTMSVLFTLSLLLPGQKVSAGTILGSATGKTLSKKLPHYTPDKGPIVRSASMKSALTMPTPTPKNKKKATQAKKKNKSKEPQPKEQLRANIGNIRVESLRYTCYRFQSDAVRAIAFI